MVKKKTPQGDEAIMWLGFCYKRTQLQQRRRRMINILLQPMNPELTMLVFA